MAVKIKTTFLNLFKTSYFIVVVIPVLLVNRAEGAGFSPTDSTIRKSEKGYFRNKLEYFNIYYEKER